ncbi:pyridine nucleotide-disulfide oxidoreductase [Burkholderia sp. MSh2]|uniref:Pyridine nucleotide-disulfide oxidoreductase n=1 Tax=Burkholderia paludis TaxID=1506587 RepID=A0A6J5F430_9BURK|nr:MULTISPECIES: FAD-dependent oxidoreductase [Burkholderia]KEZ01918.1 pyridine nucleotide-disulfide oxidoreductase [Burkholderia sp. MSh2]CAB3772075.1 p-cumate 2,3-dioxygenase system, ferredoxin--NAD(+) reductase component [Burkholderia paludis]VWC41751.1 pyridine nucleotide-disulfide oxidoreductase [Burkholderia paludis]
MKEGIKEVVIVGAGQAGATVALGLRRGGFDGEITLVGNEAYLPYERPQLSKEMLRRDRSEIRSIKTEVEFEGQRIRLVLGHKVVKTDADRRHIVLDDGREIAFDRLVIATGVKPRRLPGRLGDSKRVRCLRTADDAGHLRAGLEAGMPLAIAGGGVIGLEVAAAARALGCEVTVIEAADRLMSRSVDETVSRYLDRAHRSNGVDIRYGVHATELPDDGRLTLSDGSTVAAHSVLAGIGVIPNIEGFDDLGITDAAGVRVDAYGRTEIDGIFATGDVASQPIGDGFGRVETWANAQDHALNVVSNLLGEPVAYTSPVWFWSDQGEINLQVAGNATRGNRIVRGDANADTFSVFWLDDGDRVTGCATVNSPKDMAMARRWVKQGSRVDPQRLADPGIALRSCAC